MRKIWRYRRVDQKSINKYKQCTAIGSVRTLFVLLFFADNICFPFSNKMFRRIPMGIYCAPFIADLFLYVNSKKGHSKPSLVSLFNNNCRYLENNISINNPYFLKFAEQIYLILWMWLTLKTTCVNFSYLDIFSY